MQHINTYHSRVSIIICWYENLTVYKNATFTVWNQVECLGLMFTPTTEESFKEWKSNNRKKVLKPKQSNISYYLDNQDLPSFHFTSIEVLPTS